MKRLVLAVLAVFILVSIASAGDFNFYGSLRFSGFYEMVKAGNSNSYNTDLGKYGLQPNSRLGARTKVDDKLDAVVEFGIPDGSGSITTRLLYANYKLDSFTLRFGQDYTPGELSFSYFNQVYYNDSTLANYGAILNGRRPQIKLIGKDWQLAFVKPNVTPAAKDDVTLPKIEASYSLNMNPVNLKLVGGYQTYSKNSANKNYSADSYFLGAGMKGNFGQAKLSLVAWAGRNTNDYDSAISNSTATFTPGQRDTTDYGYALALNYALSNNLSFELGYGFASSDDNKKTITSKADKQRSYYIQAPYTIAKGFILVPEVGVQDKMKNNTGVREDKTYYAGAKLQANF